MLLLGRFPFLNIDILQSRLVWSVRLRWLAITVFLLATITAQNFSDISLDFNKIWLTLIALFTLNVTYFFILKFVKQFTFAAELAFLVIHILLDLFILTILIHLIGGVENPIYLFYIFHVVLSSIVLPKWLPYIISTLVVILFGGLVTLEYLQIIPHICIVNSNVHKVFLFNGLVLSIFTITVYLTTYICVTFMRIFRNSKIEIDNMNEKLLAAEKQKDQFFQYTSHELKSPIIAVKTLIDSVVKNYSEAIESKPLTILKRASARSAQMLDIIKELIDLSHNKSLIPRVYSDKVKVIEVLINVIQNLLPIAESKNIQLDLNTDNTDYTIVGKESDFEKVFTNIIENAIRYSKDGGKVTVLSRVANDNNLQIVVEDNGIGIPKEDLEKIFDEFYRSKNAKQIVNFGTGLGLSLVKQIIDNYSGNISVESEVNKGTKIKIIFPLLN
ncbi:MAG: HAMP domain-containing histidine kinase [Melioribacteraceae bacterium]|nr:HAMP domain-containing histidine kinase [Melioribacteraceae bacterium]